jgi:hypothetical protein
MARVLTDDLDDLRGRLNNVYDEVERVMDDPDVLEELGGVIEDLYLMADALRRKEIY